MFHLQQARKILTSFTTLSLVLAIAPTQGIAEAAIDDTVAESTQTATNEYANNLYEGSKSESEMTTGIADNTSIVDSGLPESASGRSEQSDLLETDLDESVEVPDEDEDVASTEESTDDVFDESSIDIVQDDADPIEKEDENPNTDSVELVTCSSTTAELGYALLTADGELWTCDSAGQAVSNKWTADQKNAVTKLYVAADAQSVPDKVLSQYKSSGTTSFYSVAIQLEALRTVEFLLDDGGRSAVQSIGKSAFSRLPLEQIVNLDRTGIRSIGESAFCSCTRLESISFPESLSEIGKYAFEDCSLLNEVRLPASIRALEYRSFDGCTSLEKLWIYSSTLPSLGDWTFKDTPIAKGYSASGATPMIYAPAHALWNIRGNDDDDSWSGLEAVMSAIEGTQMTLSAISVSGVVTKSWNGYAQTQSPILRMGGKELVRGTDYSISYADNVQVGTATMTLVGKGLFNGTKSVSFAIEKAINSLAASAKKTSVAIKYNANKPTTIASNISVSKAHGAISYTNASTNSISKAFSVDNSTGKVSVPKGTKVGTYSITIRISAAGDANHKLGSKTVSYKIVVTKAKQPMKLKAVQRSVKSSKLRSKAVTVAAPLKFTTKAKGKVTYGKVSGARCLTVNPKTGKVTVKKGTKKGTYKIKLKVSAKGDACYMAGAKSITCVIVVK